MTKLTLPDMRLARAYVEYVTGVQVHTMTLYACYPGKISFRFQNDADYQYALNYAELTRLGPPVKDRSDATTKHWHISEFATVSLHRSMKGEDRPPRNYHYYVTLRDNEPVPEVT